MKLARLMRKKFMMKKNSGEFLTKQSPLPAPKFYPTASERAAIVIAHNVELCKQYFLQECLLLITIN